MTASKLIKKTPAILASTFFIATSASYALETPSPSISALQDEIMWLKEETFVTTATKTQEDINKSGSSVSVITEQDLDLMGARNLMDALKRSPGLGISINYIGMPVIEVRGVKSDFSEKVLFLKNGHAINNNIVNGGATTSHHNFLIDNIKRIEVVRGPGSALYGANAFVAVINVITKDAQDLQGTEVSVGLGHNETKKLNIQTSQQLGSASYAFNASLFDSDGFRETVESDSLGTSGETNDWNKQFELGLKVSHSNFKFQGHYSKRDAGPYIGIGNALNDESTQNYAEYFLELAYTETLAENLIFNQKIYNNNFKLDNFWEVFSEGALPGFPDGFLATSLITMESLGTELQFEYSLQNHKLILGFMAEHQTLFDIGFDANFDPTSNAPLAGGFQDIYDTWPWIANERRDLQAAYFQDIWDINQSVRLIVGSRYDHYSDVGSSFNPRASLIWSFMNDSRMLFTYGTAFRAPNFGELYNANNPTFIGNPELNPEEIETFELSVNSQISKRSDISATIFKNNISEVIGKQAGFVNNGGRLEVSGLELELKSRLKDGSNLGLNYTYQYPKDKNSGERSPNIPIHIANASYHYRYSQFLSAYFGLHYRGEIRRSSADTRPNIKDAPTLDAALNLKSSDKNTHIKLSVYNVFNEPYVDPSENNTVNSDFPRAGRNFMIEVTQKL